MAASCSTCIYYGPDRPTYGRCLRYPPTVVQQGEIRSGGSTSPTVYKDGWCGEYQGKDTPSMRELLLLTHQDLRGLIDRMSQPIIITSGGESEPQKFSEEEKP